MSVGILKPQIPSSEPLYPFTSNQPAAAHHRFELGTLMRAQTYNATYTSVATAAANALLPGNNIFPISAARNTRIAVRMLFSPFKRDQSTAILTLRGDCKNRVSVPPVVSVLPTGATAATSSSIEDPASFGSFKARNTF